MFVYYFLGLMTTPKFTPMSIMFFASAVLVQFLSKDQMGDD